MVTTVSQVDCVGSQPTEVAEKPLSVQFCDGELSGGRWGSKCYWEAWLAWLGCCTVPMFPKSSTENLVIMVILDEDISQKVGPTWCDETKEHVSNYVFPIRDWCTAAAFETFRWSDSSARGWGCREVIGIPADNRRLRCSLISAQELNVVL